MLNRFFIGICLLSLLAFTACSDDDVKKGGGEDVREIVTEAFDHGVTFAYPAFVGNIDGEFKEPITEMFTNIVATPDADTRLVVLGSINEISAETLKELYENGADIAIVHPSKSELDNFIASNSWVKHFDTDDIENTILITFNKNNEVHSVSGEKEPVEFENDSDAAYDDDLDDDDNGGGVDPEYDPSEMDDYVEYKHGERCCTVAAWISYLNIKYEVSSLDGATADHDSIFFIGKNITKLCDLDTLRGEIRKSGAYRDSCKGKPSVTLGYDYKMVHVYEGSAQSGDYYIMGMNAVAHNSGMWDGSVRKVDHVGAITKICGWLLDRFQVKTTLVENSLFHKPVEEAVFPIYPSPSSDVHTGETNVAQSYSITAGGSVSGGYSKEKGPNIEGSANVSASWSWSHSEKWNVGELTIGNLVSGNQVGWKANLANYPKWQPYKFVLPTNSLLTSNVNLKGSWIWRIPDTKDNTIAPAYSLKCDVELEYFAISHVYSKTVDTRDYRSNPKRRYVIKKNFLYRFS